MKSLSHNILPLLLAATLLARRAVPTTMAEPGPTPTGYDIYTAGYKTPGGKAVATVWKNGTELYTLTDGTNDAWARSVYVADGTVYVAGYEQQPDGVVAKLWRTAP